jgi:hypothetical protein
MAKKPAALSPNLVAVKGTAAPAPDMAGRTVKEGEGDLAPLNFRVSSSFRREFKTYAAQHDLKLNELLRRSFETYRRQNGD